MIFYTHKMIMEGFGCLYLHISIDLFRSMESQPNCLFFFSYFHIFIFFRFRASMTFLFDHILKFSRLKWVPKKTRNFHIFFYQIKCIICFSFVHSFIFQPPSCCLVIQKMTCYSSNVLTTCLVNVVKKRNSDSLPFSSMFVHTDFSGFGSESFRNNLVFFLDFSGLISCSTVIRLIVEHNLLLLVMTWAAAMSLFRCFLFIFY